MPEYRTLQDEIHGRCFEEGDYPHDWLRHTRCPCCDSKRLRPHFVKWGIQHARCKSCRFVFANPYPPEQFLQDLYNGSYQPGVRKFVEIPKARAGRDDAHQSMSAEYYTEIIDYLSQQRSEGDWLDVGGGIGTFLARVRKAAPRFRFYLNEMNRDSADFAKAHYGLNVLPQSLEDICASGRRFDVVSSLAVVEHVSHPREMIAAMFSVLRPGGILFLNVPNFTRLNRWLSRGASGAVTAPFHLSLFNRRNLCKLVERCADVEVMRLWESGPQAFYLMHLAHITECFDVHIPAEPSETMSTFQKVEYTRRQLKWIPRLGRWDGKPWVERTILKWDGRVYLNLAVRKKRDAAGGAHPARASKSA